MTDIVDELRQGSLSNDDYRWKAADEIEQYRRDVDKLRSVLQRVRRWGSPMVKGYIDGALGGNSRRDSHLADGEVGEIREQEEKGWLTS